MPTWDPHLYLKFDEHRSRPCRELVARVSPGEVSRVLDLGCGPGNSTEILMERFPLASVIAMDSSEEMLAKARAAYAGKPWRFEKGAIETWAPPADWIGRVDVILSNAAFQWVRRHHELFPRLMTWLRPGGQLAVQMPRAYDLPVLREIEETAHAGAWKSRFETFDVPYTSEPTPRYYDFLCAHARTVDLLEVSYFHPMRSPDDVVEWSRGTGLRPWLERAGPERDAFLEEYRRRIHAAYPRQADGSVLMEFRRLMILATR